MKSPALVSLLFVPLAAIGCASADSAEKADGVSAPAEVATSDCDLAVVAARVAWRKQFDRVPGLAPEDRAAMAEEHSTSSDAELGDLEATANEAGDETMMAAIVSTREARATCGK